MRTPQFLSSIRTKLVLFCVVIAVCPLIWVNNILLTEFQTNLRYTTEQRLIDIRILKAEQIKHYFENIHQDIQFVAQLESVIQAAEAFTALEDITLSEGSPYPTIHQQYHPLFTQLIQTKPYSDILLISPAGKVVYSYAKKADFAANLQTNPYQQTILAQLYQTISLSATLSMDVTQFPYGTPYQAYPILAETDQTEVVCFVSMPLLSKNKLVGILVYQLSNKQLNVLLTDEPAVLPESSQIYLINSNEQIIAQALINPAHPPPPSSISPTLIQKGLAGEAGFETLDNDSNDSFFRTYQPLNINNQLTLLLLQAPQSVLSNNTLPLQNRLIRAIAITLVSVTCLAFFIAQRLVKPILTLQGAAHQIANGRLNQTVNIATADEIGFLATTFNQMVKRIQIMLDTLEERVTLRTHHLERIATLSGELNAILNDEQLLATLVREVKDHFNYCGVYIYLLTANGEQLVIRAAAGDDPTRQAGGEQSISLNTLHHTVVRAAQTAKLIKVDYPFQKIASTDALVVKIRTEIAVPIIVEKGVIGVLNVHQDQPHAAAETDVDLLRLFANQVAIALENARLFKEMQQALREMEGLFKAAQAILGGTELEAICRNLILHFGNLVKSDFMFLHLVDHKQQKILLSVENIKVGFNQPITYQELHDGIAGLVFRSKQPVLSLHADDGIEPEATKAKRKMVGFGPLMIVPLVAKNKVVGVVTAANLINHPEFTEHDINLLMALATQAAAAIDNVYLFEAEQRQRQMSDSLRQVATILSTSLERDIVLDKIIEQLGVVVSFDGASIFLLEDKTLVLSRGASFAHNFIGRRINLTDKSPMIDVLHQKQPLVITDVSIDPRWSIWDEENPIRSWMGAPLLSGDQVIGILNVDNFKVDAYTAEDVQAMQLFANQATIAIQNAHLYSRAQQELSERKRAEKALKTANQQLTKLNIDKDRFFSILAHDLKGPFTPLLGASGLIVKQLDMLSAGELKTLTDSIHQSASNIYNLLENLLHWSRLQQQGLVSKPETINLQQIIEQNVILLTENTIFKQVTLESTIASDIFVYADKYMLDTIIRNLISNALKFTSVGGSITILTQEGKTGFIEIWVVDTGEKKKKKIREKLFKADEHVSTPGTNDEQGTGLGLIICQEMVEKNGGKIWVESKPNQGTTVKFTMPLDKTLPAPIPDAHLETHKVGLTSQPPTMTEDELIWPSREKLNELIYLAQIGDMNAIIRQATILMKQDKHLRPFATRLTNLAHAFEDEAISRWLKQNLSKTA